MSEETPYQLFDRAKGRKVKMKIWPSDQYFIPITYEKFQGPSGCRVHGVDQNGMDELWYFDNPKEWVVLNDGRVEEQPEHDPVNKPRHYTSHPSGIECIQITEHMGFCVGNAVKYCWRADLKNGIEDLEKAKWYIDREIEKRKTQTT